MTTGEDSNSGVLTGRRILVTRAETQSTALIERLRTLGAEVFACPTIAILPPDESAPLEDAIRNLDNFDWVVFTSANAVKSVTSRLPHSGHASGMLGLARIAAVGAATQRSLVARGFDVDCVPDTFTSAELPEAMGDIHDLHVFLPRSSLADASLPDALRARGASVHEVIAYRTVPADDIATWGERLAREPVDAVVFTSPSTARYFLEGLRSAGALDRVLASRVRPAFICIGPTTAGAVHALVGAQAVDAVAETHDDDGVVDALVRWSGAYGRAARR